MHKLYTQEKKISEKTDVDFSFLQEIFFGKSKQERFN
jgi:hypothetical protein